MERILKSSKTKPRGWVAGKKGVHLIHFSCSPPLLIFSIDSAYQKLLLDEHDIRKRVKLFYHAISNVTEPALNNPDCPFPPKRIPAACHNTAYMAIPALRAL